MASLKERLTHRVAEIRKRRPTVDHAVRTQEHYGETQASQQAGAVTYFGFLSVFPVLALAFFVVGYVAEVFPDAQDTLVTSIESMFPGLIGDGAHQLNLEDFQNSAATAGVIGVVGLLYAGLGWLSALRNALITVFELPHRAQPNFLMGKVRDLITLVIVGSVLLFAVAFTGIVAGFSDDLLDWAGLDTELGWLVDLVTIALGLLANAVLFFAMFRLLAAPDLPKRAMWSGALVGAVGFEILKQISGLLIQLTQGNPAFQVFGLALILLVWINYFSRVILYAASWAWTHPRAREQRVVEPEAPVQGPPSPSGDELVDAHDQGGRFKKGTFAAGAALGAAAATAIARAGRGDGS